MAAHDSGLDVDVDIDIEVAERVRREGFTVLPGVLDADEVSELKGELAPYLQGRLMGRNDFEGLKSERVYALLAKAPAVAKLVEHSRVLGVVDRLLVQHYRLSAALAINLHPGETRQAFHSDDGYIPLPRPRGELGVSAIWALDAFTEENGATEVIPGSHLWGARGVSADEPAAIPVLMPAGSVLLMAGGLYHRGGANRSRATRLAITPQYCQPWLRQIENMVLAVPPEIAKRYSPRVQALLGYDIMEPTFIGYVDGRHPRRLIDPDHRPQTWLADVLTPSGARHSDS